jgi:hypothetical protein
MVAVYVSQQDHWYEVAQLYTGLGQYMPEVTVDKAPDFTALAVDAYERFDTSSRPGALGQ